MAELPTLLSVIGSCVRALLGSLRTNLSIILIKMKVKWVYIQLRILLPLIYLVDPASCSGRLDRPLVKWGGAAPPTHEQ